jgi:hypothetical protein
VGAVLGARQTGKTSLLLKARLQLGGKHAIVFVDLQPVIAGGAAECFRFVAGEMLRQLAQWGVKSTELPGDSPSFLAFLRTASKCAQAVRIVVMLDEFGAVSPSVAKIAAHTLRSAFTSRVLDLELQRFVFILAGATDLLEWTVGANSPLKNVTDSIYLEDLALDECSTLLAYGLGIDTGSARTLAARLYPWTNGHPYWTQTMGSRVGGTQGIKSDVDAMVDDLLHSEDTNLPYLMRSLDRCSPEAVAVVRSVLDGEQLEFARSDTRIAELEMIGALKNAGGLCAIRNGIYRAALLRRKRRVVAPSLMHSAIQDGDVAPRRTEVFVSYSHRDQKWLGRFQVMLTPLLRGVKVALWDDTRIKPGSDWKTEIRDAIQRASVAILLVSPDFLASDFIDKNELPPLLQAAKADGLRILWVPITDSLYRQTSLEKFQAASDPAKPLEGLDRATRHRVIRGICEEVARTMVGGA